MKFSLIEVLVEVDLVVITIVSYDAAFTTSPPLFSINL